MNKAEFLTDLKLLDISEGTQTRLFELEVPFRVYSGVLDAIIEVPAGFECDSESIPVWLQCIAPPFAFLTSSRRFTPGNIHSHFFR